MKYALLAGLLFTAACSRQPALNYRHCLKLRIGMTREQVFAAMGPPEETHPYIEGKSLPHLKDHTAYEWSTPASMPAGNRVSFNDTTTLAESIHCGDSVITTAVFIEPAAPAISTTVVYGVQISSSSPVAPAARRSLRERGSSSSQSSGRPLTE